jgi:hypothetical protein
MPYSIEKSGNKFIVKNTATGHVKGTHSTKEKAESQMRLLQAIEHNPGFKPKKK